MASVTNNAWRLTVQYPEAFSEYLSSSKVTSFKYLKTCEIQVLKYLCRVNAEEAWLELSENSLLFSNKYCQKKYSPFFFNFVVLNLSCRWGMQILYLWNSQLFPKTAKGRAVVWKTQIWECIWSTYWWRFFLCRWNVVQASRIGRGKKHRSVLCQAQE